MASSSAFAAAFFRALDIEDRELIDEERPSTIFIAAEWVRPDGAVNELGHVVDVHEQLDRTLKRFLVLTGAILGMKSATVMPRGRGLA